MKKVCLGLLTVFLFVVVYSCYETEFVTPDGQAISEQAKEPRAGMRSSSISGMSKTAYAQLSEARKIAFWIERCTELVNHPAINSMQQNLLNQMIAELQTISTLELTTNLVNIGNQLTNEFSESDFMAIFVSPYSYSFSGVNAPICTYCHVSIGTGTGPVAGLPNCNCRWTCGGPESGPSSCVNSPGQQDCCIEVHDWCGFINWQPCNGHDTLF